MGRICKKLLIHTYRDITTPSGFQKSQNPINNIIQQRYQKKHYFCECLISGTHERSSMLQKLALNLVNSHQFGRKVSSEQPFHSKHSMEISFNANISFVSIALSSKVRYLLNITSKIKMSLIVYQMCVQRSTNISLYFRGHYRRGHFRISRRALTSNPPWLPRVATLPFHVYHKEYLTKILR